MGCEQHQRLSSEWPLSVAATWNWCSVGHLDIEVAHTQHCLVQGYIKRNLGRYTLYILVVVYTRVKS